jgi:hypothetical protein
MRIFNHPMSGDETSRARSEPGHASRPAPQDPRGEAPGQADEPPAEWENLWIDLGGEG